MAAASDDQRSLKIPTENNDDKENHVLGPLEFPSIASKPSTLEQCVPCMFCERMFENTIGKNDALLHHLLVHHQLVIADVDQVCDLKRYCEHWKKRFKDGPITDFCSQININSKPGDVGPQIHYYLLCDALPEERVLREEMQQQRLEAVLESQQRERSDSNFSRKCLFCNQYFEENRSWLFSHMAEDHGFNVGQPDNIVYVNEFLDLMETTLNNLQCLFCEKQFKDRATLKEHMRKKQHKKINPKNKQYDRFYIINYLTATTSTEATKQNYPTKPELGKTWEQLQQETDDNESDNQPNDNDDWSDWTEDPEPVICLFCEYSSKTVTDLLQHMKESHQFSLLEVRNSLGLHFYGQVKIVNFIRKKVYDLSCSYCQEKFPSRQDLLEHQTNQQHFKLPDDKTVWDMPQHYFSTYENDRLLCCLEDDDDDDDDEKESSTSKETDREKNDTNVNET